MNIIPFSFESKEIRVVEINNEPWFVAADICAVLGFGNPRQAIESHVDLDDVQKLDTLTTGGVQRLNHINESGLYALIFGSKLETAKTFKKWVTSTVLPSIRKTGTYSVQSISRKDLALMIVKVEEEKEALLLINKQQEEEISYLQTLFNEGMTPSQFVKKLNGVNCQKVNELLAENGWLRHDKHGWRVASYARDKYLTEKDLLIEPEEKPSFVTYQPVLLRAGAVRLFELYAKGKLPMKKTWNGQYTHDKSIEVAA